MLPAETGITTRLNHTLFENRIKVRPATNPAALKSPRHAVVLVVSSHAIAFLKTA